ncbi:MAG: hypothetical protein NTV30_00140, partial [Chloroflexi bacterium]|nr:hypothetical protein [Chloroflexota bacterium]
MKLIKISFCFILLLILLGASTSVRAEGEGKKNKNNKVLSPNGTGPYITKFNINNISTFFSFDGDSDLDPVANAGGFQFPIGSGKSVFYESGFLYGGYVNGEWRVSGSTYNRGQVGGRIITPGTATVAPVAEDPNGNDVRIYRVRRDYKDPQADYSKEIADEGISKAEIYAQYDIDWQQWPAKTAGRPWGNAPFEDKNGNGVYDPIEDIPGVPGADQTIWFVCNDTDPTQSIHLY